MASNWWLGGAASAAVVSILVACAPAAEVTGASGDRVTTGTFDKNDVVSDAALLDKDALTTEQIQAFLDKTPWNTKSALASYTEDGQSAAQIITTVSQKYGVNPIALMVRVQMEQSLLYKDKATATDTAIKIAFGCGCPHSSICSAKYEGFANQADCAAGTLARSIAAATTSTGTASGWKKGVVKTTVDKIAVNPANAATAALYTYTPYVGEAGGGDKGVGGASLHKSVWDKVTTALKYTPGANPTTTATATTTTTTDAGTSTDDTSDPDDTSDTGDTTTDDAGAPTTTTTPTKASAAAAAADDASLLKEGSAPPAANNVPLPQSSGSHKSTSSSSATTTSGSASSDDNSSSSSSNGDSSNDGTTTSKPVASSGCSSTGHGGGGSGLFAGISVAIVGLLSRRRRANG